MQGTITENGKLVSSSTFNMELNMPPLCCTVSALMYLASCYKLANLLEAGKCPHWQTEDMRSLACYTSLMLPVGQAAIFSSRSEFPPVCHFALNLT